MTQQLLEHKRIPATIYQILAGKGMAVQMCACLLDTTGAVVVCNRKAQTVSCQHISELIAEQIIGGNTAPKAHILPKYTNHHTTQRNDLYFTVFIVA